MRLKHSMYADSVGSYSSLILSLPSESPTHGKTFKFGFEFDAIENNVSAIAINDEFKSVSMLVPSHNRKTKDPCSLFTWGRDSISNSAEQFSFRNIGDDSRSNISFHASLG